MDIVILPGDGVGPEISAATLDVLKAADAVYGLGLVFETRDMGLKTLKEQGTTLPPDLLDRVRRSDGAILGPVSHYEYPPREQGGINPSGEFRVKLDLFANIRPCKSRPGVSLARTPMDLVIVRECTEGFYSDRNMFAAPASSCRRRTSVLSMRKITAHGCEPDLARRLRAGAQAPQESDGRPQGERDAACPTGCSCARCARSREAYPDVQLDEQIVDAMAALLIRDPSRFDVIVTSNMFGDILSDEASELSGSLGLAGSVNADETLCCAQAQHGSAPDIAGQDRANPTSLILSAAMLLDWLASRHGRPEFAAAAQAINDAIDRAIADPSRRTADLGGKLGTRAFGVTVAEAVRAAKPRSNAAAD